MPATRSSNTQHRPNPFPTSSPPRTHNHGDSNPDVISFSSSEGEGSGISLKQKRPDKGQLRQRVQKPPQHITEVIEISSDEDEDTSTPYVNPQSSAIADYRRQISKIREESMKHKRDFERASRELKELREENQQLQALRTAGDGKIVLDAAQLTDNLDCEICTSRMWTPYVLPDCGHTFCQSCLHDWFSTTQMQYIATHPDYNPNYLIANNNALHLVNLIQAISQNPHAANNPQMNAIITQFLPQHPQYTCPTCREPVRSRPTEAFALKALVRTVAAATGENSPKKHAPANRKGKAIPPVPASGPWDGFFPPKQT